MMMKREGPPDGRIGALLLLNQMVTSSRVRVMTKGTGVRWPCSISLRGGCGRKAPGCSPSTTGAKASHSPSCTYFSPYTCEAGAQWEKEWRCLFSTVNGQATRNQIIIISPQQAARIRKCIVKESESIELELSW